jgi:uncharacterized hydrophobic protein (TIGR00271 family)
MLPFLARVFDLRRNQNTPEAIAADIAEGAEVAGPNLWVLFFAIVVASVGLNVNSTAVIIGAMLISPLMGPIVAIGYGVGVDNFALIRRAFKSLGLFTGIGLATSTLYFLLTPLSQAQSELLARTTPTVWDVLIACAGGGAGMIAATRRKPSNIVPGVAIATALMPPLCTAGYGLANGRLAYVSGALFLFSINAVFIALSTLLVVKTSVPSASCGSVVARSLVIGKSTYQPALLARFTLLLLPVRIVSPTVQALEPAAQVLFVSVCCTKVDPTARGLPHPVTPSGSLIA